MYLNHICLQVLVVELINSLIFYVKLELKKLNNEIYIL